MWENTLVSWCVPLRTGCSTEWLLDCSSKRIYKEQNKHRLQSHACSAAAEEQLAHCSMVKSERCFPQTPQYKKVLSDFSCWLSRRSPLTDRKFWHTSAFPLCCHCCCLASEPSPGSCRVVAVCCDYSLLQGWHPPGVLALWQGIRIQELNNCSDGQVDIYREGRFSCVSSKQAFITLLAQHELICVTSGPWLSL